MLWSMQIRLDTWGRLAALTIGMLLPAFAEAHAGPPAHPRAGDDRGGLPLVSPNDADLFGADDLEEQVAIDSAPSEWNGVDVAIDDTAHEATADYDLALDQDPTAMTEFQEVLEPYGSWAEDATYGTVWIPHTAVVGDDFAPYVTAGHWALTENDEWLWVSDYDWGWAPFHYGRWVWISGRGWAWIPGRVYAPAWVVWRTGYYDDYYVGWAPMPPTWYWRGGIAVSLWAVPPAPYVFCSSHHIWRPHVHRHIVPAARVRAVASHTRPYYAATPTGRRSFSSYVRGPSARDARIPASAAPRAEHHPRALAAARPVPGGRLGAVGRGVDRSRAIPQPRSLAPLPRQASPSPIRPARPSAPLSVERRPTPRATTPTPRPTPTPHLSPRPPAVSPRPIPTPSPRPTPAPRPSLRPAPKATPAPARIAPQAVRPSASPGRLAPASRPHGKGGRR